MAGCFTCRLRRKKCDEGSPTCAACRHLGLQCEYKRPEWWSNNDERRQHKEDIKNIIKRKKLAEKSSHALHTSFSPPPGLSHSLPTSATYTDPLDRTRSASVDTHLDFNFNSPPAPVDYAVYGPPPLHPDFIVAGYSPYEVDVKTERQMFVDDVPTLRESHVATFSTYQTPPRPAPSSALACSTPAGTSAGIRFQRRPLTPGSSTVITTPAAAAPARSASSSRTTTSACSTTLSSSSCPPSSPYSRPVSTSRLRRT